MFENAGGAIDWTDICAPGDSLLKSLEARRLKFPALDAVDCGSASRVAWIAAAQAQLEPVASGVGGDEALLGLAFDLWAPLAMELAHCLRRSGRPWIQGICGTQGTGKSTMCSAIAALLRARNIAAASLSIDDVYRTHAERSALARRDPALRHRGPPGTHDVDFACEVLTEVKRGHRVALPTFDKAALDGAGERGEPRNPDRYDVLLFEGWLVGAEPVRDLAEGASPLLRASNERLKEYQRLWNQLDGLWVLRPEAYDLSRVWRREAEARLRSKGRGGMTDEQIDEFVGYFFEAMPPELYVDPLTQPGSKTDLVINIDAQHTPRDIRRLSIPRALT